MPSVRLLVLVTAALAGPAIASENWSSRSGLFQVSYESELRPVVINRMHSWVLYVTDADGTPVAGANISVDGGMPIHDHGLPSEPQVTQELDAGQYLLEGLRFHMNGQWEIEITIVASGGRDVVIIPLRL